MSFSILTVEDSKVFASTSADPKGFAHFRIYFGDDEHHASVLGGYIHTPETTAQLADALRHAADGLDAILREASLKHAPLHHTE